MMACISSLLPHRSRDNQMSLSPTKFRLVTTPNSLYCCSPQFRVGKGSCASIPGNSFCPNNFPNSQETIARPIFAPSGPGGYKTNLRPFLPVANFRPSISRSKGCHSFSSTCHGNVAGYQAQQGKRYMIINSKGHSGLIFFGPECPCYRAVDNAFSLDRKAAVLNCISVFRCPFQLLPSHLINEPKT